jgi:hypothetical protein
VTSLAKNENSCIYGFDNESFTHDVANYKDFRHHSPQINDFILDSIYKKTHILTQENIDEYFRKMKKEVEEFDLKPFYDQIKDLKELKS